VAYRSWSFNFSSNSFASSGLREAELVRILALAEALASLKDEATPPDLR
jgi:hypothetical protein